MDNNKEIGKRIKEARESAKLTLDEIADRVGVASSTIQRYETGYIKKIKLPIINSISEALQVDPMWILGKSPKDSSKKYFLNEEAASLAQEIYENPELRILFDTTRKVDPEDLRLITKMVSKMVKEENGEED
ncbi:helix-turn-helix domain-containing protein [Macellibacteroides fermentans]|uniref:helix-turn-helix domain-containing protein n=1 Tax=Macellibacteroides fermentans TaxID=879969 RepID=UPI00406BF3F0